MFVLVTYKPDTDDIRNKVVAVIGEGGRAFHPLKGTAYIAQVLSVNRARDIQEKLEAIHEDEDSFDYNWFCINPVTTGYYFPEEKDQRDSWANFPLYEGILRRDG